MDNTLTLSRQEALSETVRELERIQKKYHISIASGAELNRMTHQVPIRNITWFAQNGNELFEHGKNVWTNELPNKEEIYNHITLLVNYYGKHYPNYETEDRGSSIVISFTGFHAPFGIKHTFDPDRKIRLGMLDKFPHPNAYVAGSSGIDYIPFTKGDNIKNYITKFHIKPADCLYIGDALDPGMNDHSVVGVIPTFAVKNPTETLEFIKQL